TQHVEFGRACAICKRIGIRSHALIKFDGMEMKVVETAAVAVVVQAFAQLPEYFGIGGRNSNLLRVRVGLVGQVVAECGNSCPCPVAPGKVLVDDEAGTNRRGSVDVGVEQGVTRNFSGKMVIEIAHACSGLQYAEQRGAV